MIRSAIFSLLTLSLLIAGFYVYWQYQPQIASVTRPVASTNPAPLLTDDSQMKIGPGRGAWAQSFDDKGKLSSSFRADEFSPQKDRSFKVVHPESIFYLDDGQYMVVTGDHGIVFAEADGSSGATDAAPMHPPNNGVLEDVKIFLFPNHDAAEPTLKIEMNNARFDNDTLRLYTQGYQDRDGKMVPADMVPVTVRGEDYDFDGTGLTLRWDDRDHRLQLLEIAHGQRLTIKHPSKASMPGEPAAAATPTLSASPAMLADADSKGAALALSPPAAVKGATPYQAVFHDNVRINQGDLQVASAGEMTVDFLKKGEKRKSAGGGSGGAEGLAPGAIAPPPVDVEPTIPPAAQKIAESGGVTPNRAAGSETTQPNPPVTVFWTGKLRITPLDSGPILPIVGGQAVVKLVGTPVRLTPKDSTVTAADVVYRTLDSAARLENSAAFPHIEIRQPKAHFVADSFAYDPTTSLATIQGQSKLEMEMEDGQLLHSSWNDRGVFHIITKAGQPETVDRGDLYGQVVVNHPRFSLNSDQLGLDLIPTASPSAGKGGVTLKRATATGNAVCQLADEKGGQREIDGNTVVIETTPGADGKPIPRSVLADGLVKAFDSDQKLTAGHLEALLRPKADATTQPGGDAMELESMDAKDKVNAVLKNGAIADADQLHVRMKEGHQEVVLTGLPATVDDGKGGILTGPSIFILPDDSSLAVQGAGRMSRLRKATTQPLVVSWGKSLALDGPKNTLDVLGGVQANAIDANGTAEDMTCDSAHADLMDVPKDGHFTLRNSQEDAESNEDFGGKALQVLTLNGSVHGTSLLKSTDGKILRHGEIWGLTLVYHAETGKTEMPGSGRLLVENHKPVDRPVVADSGSLGSNYGNLVMGWAKGLTYDPPARTIVFEQDVQAWVQQDTKDAALMKMTRAKSLTAFLEPAPTSEPVADSSKQPKMQLSHMTANGDVNFDAKTVDLTADSVDYDPKTDLMKALGTDLQPVEVIEEDGSKKSFESATFNVKTQMLESSSGTKGDVHR